MNPPIEYARQEWLFQFQAVLATVCNLRRIQSSRYEISLGDDPEIMTYEYLVALLPETALARAVGIIERKVQEVSGYVNKWLQFQSLWDLEVEVVYQVGSQG